MRTVSAKALAYALLVGGMTSAVVQPAAAKNQSAEEAAAPTLSKEFRAAAGPVQTAIEAKDFATASAGIAATEAAAVSPYEKYVAAKFRLMIAANSNDTAAQSRAVDAILASGHADAQELPGMYFYAGNFAYADGKFERAVSNLAQAVKLGYKDNNVSLLLADSYLKLNRLDEAFALARQAITTRRAAGQTVPEDWYNRPASAAQKAGRLPDLLDFLALRLQDYPSAPHWRNTAIVYLQAFKPDGAATLDTLRLMNATGGLQTRAEYYEWAASALESGLPGEAIKAYKAGVAAGQVNQSDSEFLAISKKATAQVSGDRAGLAAAEKAAAGAANGTAAKATGDAWLGYDEYARSVAMYRLALQKGGVDAATVNTRLGIALALSGDYAGAKQAFDTVTSGPRAGLARLWNVYVTQKMSAGAANPAPVG